MMIKQKRLQIFFMLAAMLAAAAVGANEAPKNPQSKSESTAPAVGASGMVSSAHPLATQAGLDILAAGGNAFDAAIAVAATLNVVEPMMSGVGGYGAMIIYDASKREIKFLDSSGRVPATLDSDVFRPPTPDYQKNRLGAKSISTPGNANAWEALSNSHGKLQWRRLFDAAIKAASEGFVISEKTAEHIKAEFNEFPEQARSIYGRNGEPLKAGDRLTQKDLAASLRMIAEQGARAIHGGELGKAIDSTMREAGAFLTIDDLRKNRAEWRQPVSIDYRGYKVITASAPTNAWNGLLRLGIMSRFDLTGLGHNSAAHLHRYAEATKLAYSARLKFASDPDISPPPLAMLLSEKYWAEEAAKINLRQAASFAPPIISSSQGEHTTHYVVADKQGNIVTSTQTLGNRFGSKVMAKGTGIWLNNSLAYSTFEPKGNPMDAFPGRRKLAGFCPAIIMRDGKPWAAIGTPGGHTIVQTVPQMVMNLIDFRMDIQQAISAPRISFAEPDVIAVDNGVPEAVRKELSAMGHNIRIRSLGNAHGLTIEYDEKGKPIRFTGGADPRGEGAAIGLGAVSGVDKTAGKE
ncbi:MAG TPA: gamma-glutamyltransferase [Blastocatellia bacterium]|nr:gamma-glutamyltransferase [Blastocatellia bacterium]